VPPLAALFSQGYEALRKILENERPVCLSERSGLHVHLLTGIPVSRSLREILLNERGEIGRRRLPESHRILVSENTSLYEFTGDYRPQLLCKVRTLTADKI
jgi:hypothetical protein